MSEKHTPGPWDIVWGPIIRVGDIAMIPQSLDGKHTANAHLIAAAPDLLKLVVSVYKQSFTDCGLDLDTIFQMEKILKDIDPELLAESKKQLVENYYQEKY